MLGRLLSTSSLVLLTTSSLVVLTVGSASADCNTNNEVTTCTGDVYPYVDTSIDGTMDATDVRSFIFEMLTDNAGNGGQDAAIELTSTGEEGDNHTDPSQQGRPMTITFTGGQYGIDSSQYSLFIQSEGGQGHSGNDNGSDGSDSSHSGGGGQPGGAGGALTLNWNSGDIADNRGLWLVNRGGDGGEGGSGKTGTGDTGEGGPGGIGGAGDAVSVTFGADAPVTANAGIFQIGGFGGVGGQGGEGYNGTKTAQGGKGGQGGLGSDIQVTFDDAFTFSPTSAGGVLYGFLIAGVGGEGGAGGNATGVFDDTTAGDGGLGGEAGTISLDATNAPLVVSLLESNGAAINLVSQGGRGGHGGNASGGSNVKGGDGAEGGIAGVITVAITDPASALTTQGDYSQGLLAQSLGGEGGKGGNGSAAVDDGKGGGGGGGGNAERINITYGGSITTTGNESNGILAQSVGGLAGNAGGSSGIVTYGASSNSGGYGYIATVTLTSTAAIETHGDHSAGVIAQAVGGGGGRGSSGSGVVALGGDGSAGGTGGAAEIMNNGGSVTTLGDYSDGLLAQSIGGSGGSAGGATGLVAIGGASGSGGAAGIVGPVTVMNSGQVSTAGDYSNAIVAQSIGGGGGSGHSASGIAAIGGSAGDGGAGGVVNVTSTGVVSTGGAHADGLFIQSVGGGGGRGTSAYSASANVSVAIGGSGGNGGNGDTVTVLTGGSVATTGDHARGIVAQSVGGGGGHGGNDISASAGVGFDVAVGASGAGGNGGSGGTVGVGSTTAITTSGSQATALFVQSVGGGGGTSGMSITSANSSGLSVGVSVGADGGFGGNGNSVTVSSSGAIVTTGSQSSGVVGQSVGGGGGNAGTTINVNGASEVSLSSAIGGSGGDGGDAGTVSVSVAGDVSTMGDSASAIHAQSVGGGGGNGAITVAGSLTSSSDMGFALGGSGGSGGKGGMVEVNSSGNLTTIGDHSSAIFAHSTSDGGGNGGLSIAGSGMSGGDANIAVGGNGGSGGASGDVSVTSSGNILAAGAFAAGIKAMSTAGGGGSATGAINGTVSSMGEVGVTIGGKGGSGGDAGDVSVGAVGNIATLGDYSDAIFASSQGGGGGHGGFAVQGALTGGEYSGTTNVTVGGDGGQAGTGGNVTVNVDTDSLTAIGYQSRGILASSVGGAGGHGGSAYSGNITMSSSVGMNVGVTIGGKGGSGAVGGDVSVTSNTDIATEGHLSDGIFAQSVGGNGGYGGNSSTIAMQIAETSSANFDVTVGGGGGDGNDGGEVTVAQSGSIATFGNSSTGIYAQSVGGGGGRGGNAASALVDLTTDTQPEGGTQVTINANTVVGGNGGGGGIGGDVTVTNDGTISVAGQGSYGIFAQSIGGGGGDGGSSSSYVFSVSGAGCTYTTPILSEISCEGASGNKSDYTPTLQLAIGGQGGTGGNAGDVEVENTGDITTAGDASSAIFAQSIGGGGGVGGNGALGDSFVAPLGIAGEAIDFLADVAEEGFHNSRSYQSADIVIGGNGSAGGVGRTVTVQNSGALTTHGVSADAIFAQSLGGGGGAGGAANGGFGTLIGVLVGAQGGAGGNGNAVSVTSSGQITTFGESALGIFAQSVGGGGGRAGDIGRSLDGTLGVNLNIGKGLGVQENAGNGGNGGDVTILLDEGGGITTSGDYAHGIFAHSVGGSGGSAHIDGIESSVSWTGSGGADGSGGDVTITTHAPISVSGGAAHGIFAQSVSGNTNDAGSVSGDITIDVGANITSTGTDGRGLLLQSDGFIESGAISVTVEEAATVSNTVLGSDTIGISNGTGNTLTNYGTISKPENDAVNNYVIRTAFGGLSINNQGTLEGSIFLDDETELGEAIINTFDNSGLFNMGLEATLGKGATLTNDGTLSPGGTDKIITTVLSATLDQETDGTYLVDLSMGISPTDGTADEIVGEKIAVSFAGGVTVNPTGVNLLTSGEGGSVYILQTADTTISSMTATVTDSASVDYSLAQVTNSDGITINGTTYSSADAIQLSYTVDYSGGSAGAALGSNGLRFAGILNDIVGIARDDFAAGSEERDAVTDTVNLVLSADDIAELRKIYEDHVPDEAGIGVASAVRGSLNLHDLLQSCPVLDRYPTAGFLHQKDCVWARFDGWAFDQDATGSTPSYTENSYGFAAGVQREIGTDLFVEAAGNYELTYVDGRNFSQDGFRFTAGAALKKEVGALTLSSTVSGGYYQSDYTRNYMTDSGQFAAHSDPSGQYVGGELRAYGIFPYQQFYAKPNLALSVLQTWQNGFTETGSGSFNQSVGSISQTSVALRPSLELGQALQLNNHPATLFVRGGLTSFLTDPDITITSQFSDFGGTLPIMTTGLSQDRYFAELQAGIEMDLDDRFSLTAKFQSAFSENTQALGGYAKLNFDF